MRVFFGFNSLPKFRSAVVAVGSFDGLHSGHHIMISKLLSLSRELGGESVMLTFEPHPRVVLSGGGDGLKLLTTLDEKISIAESCGVENIIVIPFDREFSQLSYLDFVEQYLVEKVGIKALVVGYNHRFGRNHEGNYNLCLSLADRCGFSLEMVSEWRDGDEKVSSTVIRNLIKDGEMAKAVEMLAHPYPLFGVASQGSIIISEPLKLLPKSGRYLAEARGEDVVVEIADDGDILCNLPDGDVRLWIFKEI
ncbi:MAG: FAD synthetase [Rikenellaceae bacterium]